MVIRFAAALAVMVGISGCHAMSGESESASVAATSPSHQVTQNINDSNSPCHSFRIACAQAGFQLGTTKGNRLIGDCIIPLINGKTPTSSVTSLTAQIPSGAQAAACASRIHHGTKLPKFGSNAGGGA